MATGAPLAGLEENPMNTQRSIVLETTVSFFYWIMLGAALWLLLRGHNAPGGGFVAALVAVAATAAHALMFGTAAARARLLLAPLCLSAIGLALAAASGLPALVAGQAFLTHWWGELAAPGLALKISTVLLFDLGVALCVWGALGEFCLRLLESVQ
jgi:multisubunit Na+/H+ antiporter MnhB subunit